MKDLKALITTALKQVKNYINYMITYNIFFVKTFVTACISVSVPHLIPTVTSQVGGVAKFDGQSKYLLLSYFTCDCERRYCEHAYCR